MQTVFKLLAPAVCANVYSITQIKCYYKLHLI